MLKPRIPDQLISSLKTVAETVAEPREQLEKAVRKQQQKLVDSMRSIGSVMQKQPSLRKSPLKTTNAKLPDSSTTLNPLTTLERLNLIRLELTHVGLESLIGLSKPDEFFQRRNLNAPRRLWRKWRDRSSQQTTTPTAKQATQELEGRRLREDSLTVDDLELLSQLTEATTLTLNCLGVTDEHLKQVEDLRPLQALDLSCNPDITEMGMSSVGKLTELQFLSLDEVSIGDAGFAKLRELRQLTCLRCDQTGLTDQSSEWIGSLSELIALSANDNELTNIGVQHLGGLTKIERLSLSGTNVTDESSAILARLTSLTGLALDSTALTDASINSLARLTKLKFLSICDTNITDTGFGRLAEALPDCDLWY